MNKKTLGIIAGISIGFLVIVLVFGFISTIPFLKEKLQAGNTQKVTESQENLESESQSEIESEDTQTEIIDSESQMTEETETMETETQEPEPAPTPTPTPTPQPSKPVTSKHPYYIKVNRQMNCVTIYSKDANGAYTVPVKAMVCSVGMSGNTPLGVYPTQNKYVWRELFGNEYGYYTTRIVGHFLFHSVPYDIKDNTTLLTEEYNRLGEAASAGCIRLTVEDAKWIYDNCALGTYVEIYDAEDPGPLGKPTSLKIDLSSPYKGWDPTDPAENNPWKTVVPEINGVKDIVCERNSNTDYIKGVTGKDSFGNTLEVEVTGKVNLKECGSYKVTYSVVDPIGNTASKTATITVKDTKAPVITQDKSIVITDSSSDIETIVKNALSLTDNGEKMDKLNLVLNLSNLTDAMAQNTYGNIVCEATATDKYNNKSTAFRILISYEKDDVEAPVITVVTPGTANVDLTGITTETERRNKMLNAAIAGVIKGTHYTVTDDVSAGAELNCEVTGEYSGNTTAGTHDVTLTITVTDKSGKSSTALITVTVTVVDNTAATSANVAQE